MAKIAVYDKFYETNVKEDIITPALQATSHRVIGKARRLRDAVDQILHFIEGDPKDRPDIVIMSGRLDGEEEYKKHPAFITDTCIVKQRKWYGTQDVETRRTTFLLPRFKARPDIYEFPGVMGDHPRLPYSAARQWESLQTALAAPLISRMVHTYLPDTVRLGVSDHSMYDSILHKVVLRPDEDAAHQMYGHVQYYGGIADMDHGQQGA